MFVREISESRYCMIYFAVHRTFSKSRYFITVSCIKVNVNGQNSFSIHKNVCNVQSCNTNAHIIENKTCTTDQSTCLYCTWTLSAQLLLQKAAPLRMIPSFNRKNRREHAAAGQRILFFDQCASEHALVQNCLECTWMQDSAASPTTFLQQL